MRRSQLKLMGALAALVALVVLVAGALAERRLRNRDLARITRSLEDQAALVAELSRGVPYRAESMARLDAIADRAGAAAGTRVTLIAPDGTVVGDSDVPLERLPGVENHAGRPEIARALSGAAGRSERRSDTVGRPLLYVAIPVAQGRGGVARVAMDLSDLERAVAGLRRELLAAGALGLLAALALSYAVAWATLRPVEEIRRLTAAVAGGDLDYRLPRRFTDELGEIAGAIRQLAEQLREQLAETTAEKERLRAVLDGMGEGVLVVDRNGAIDLANDRLREFFAASAPLEGRMVLEAVRHAGLADLLAAVRETGEPATGAIEVVHPAPRTLRVHAVRFPADAAAPLGIVAVFHDVTELARLEKVRREFVANASHELRTPLAAIRGFAETLLGNPGIAEEDRHRYLEVIDRHSTRLGNLVDDLLELSRIEGGTTELRIGAVDVGAMASALVGDLAERCREKRLEASAESRGETVARADGPAVEQILMNLLDNAIKYTEPGGRIQVAVEEHEDGIRTRVEDTGVGIPADDLGRIFERFYRVDKARSRELGGTGLGLSIVKHLVQALDGEIRVESEPGKGSVFSFTLPRAPT